MKPIILINLLLILIPHAKSDNLWNTKYPEISIPILQRGESIKLRKNFTELQIRDLTGTLYFDSLSQLRNMKFVSCAFVLFIVHSTRSCTFRDSAVHEIAVTTLEKEKPIQLENNHQEVQITGLNGILYSNSFTELHSISDLGIICNQIRKIESGALCSSKNVKILELDLSGNSNPPTLTKTMFDECTLDELTLNFDDNFPSEMDNDALENLQNLKEISIDGLHVPHLKKDLFKLNQQNLLKLVLSNGNVSKIDSDAFENSTNLEEIHLVYNAELTSLPEGLFRKLSKLKRLVLRNNRITNLTWNEFEGLSSLQELNLADNQISYLDVNKIAKNMPRLIIFSVDLNPVENSHKQEWTKELESKYKKIYIIIDPVYDELRNKNLSTKSATLDTLLQFLYQ